MFHKLLDALKKPKEAMTPRQGKRLIKEESASGDLSFTIKGQGRPGFFIIFGLMFGGVPTILLIAMIFGTPAPDSSTGARIFGYLFLIPFFLVGGSTFFTGLFLWFGTTVTTLKQATVSVQRLLFGKAFQQKEFQRSKLKLHFEESHRSNEVPSYKLTFEEEGAKKKIGVGGSLKEDELLWLEREVKQALGHELEEHHGVHDAMMNNEVANLSESDLDPNYRSKNLSFTKTHSGWEANHRATKLGAIGLILFGSIFFLAGVFMNDSARGLLFDLIPALREALSSAKSSDAPPPLWFSLIFGGVGLTVMLFGIFLLGYRSTISKRHSRLHIERRWLIFISSQVHELSSLTDLKTKQNGNVNEDPRFRLTAHFKNKTSVKLLGFASASDTAQIYARLREYLPEEWSPPTLSGDPSTL